MGDKVFGNMQEVMNFFEFMFGNLKIVHELYGELAQIRQKSNEDIVLYSNRIKILGRHILKAGMNDANINFRDTETGLDRVLLKYFLRGIKPDIRVRLIPCATFDETIKEAVVVEREVGIYAQGNTYASMATSIKVVSSNNSEGEKCDICGGAHLTTACEIFRKALNEHNKKANEINAVGNSQNNRGQAARFLDKSKIICHYCKKPGQMIKDCRRRIYNNNRAAREQASGNASGASTSGVSQSASTTPNQ